MEPPPKGSYTQHKAYGTVKPHKPWHTAHVLPPLYDTIDTPRAISEGISLEPVKPKLKPGPYLSLGRSLLGLGGRLSSGCAARARERRGGRAVGRGGSRSVHQEHDRVLLVLAALAPNAQVVDLRKAHPAAPAQRLSGAPSGAHVRAP